MDFDGRHILVTGASTGIGRATALLLASRGARLSLVARSADKLAGVAAAIRDRGGEAAHFAADVGDPAALAAAFDAAEAAFGPALGLFANAGTGGAFGPVAACSDTLFDDVIRVNLTSVFWAMKRVLPAMVERRCGAIVVTGSLASERGMPGNAAYVASKHGLLGLARAIAAEAAPHGVRVNCVIPGLIETPMLASLDRNATAEQLRDRLGSSVPQGRIGSPEEVAELVGFLLSDAASHITAQSIAVDGGMLGTILP